MYMRANLIKSCIVSLSLLLMYASVFGQQFASSSVLKDGTWHKISVPSDGVYIIDYNFINNQLGINPQNLSFSGFGIFGQGMGLLPESNSAFRVDDNTEIAIRIRDNNNNGRWDPSDYVLFYAKGPDAFNYDFDTQAWSHEKNPYTDVASYFITTNKGTAKSLSVVSPAPASGGSITTYDYIDYFEEDINNLVFTEYPSTMGSGREWYGRVLNNIARSQQISFTVPDIVTTSPVQIRSRFAAASWSSSNFTVRVNGNNLYTQTVSARTQGDYPPVAMASISGASTLSGNNINIEVTYNSNNTQDKGWIDYVRIHAMANLRMSGPQLLFRNFATAGQAARFRIAGAAESVEIWEVTRPYNIVRINTSVVSGNLEFSCSEDTILKQFAAVNVNSTNFPSPAYAGRVTNQNLHGISNVDLVIVTNNTLLQPAERLAGFRRDYDGYNVAVVTVEEIYNEFSSGHQDLTAIRDFFRMLYLKGQSSGRPFRYALLFGDASFDFKNRIAGNEIQNIVPSFQSRESLDILRTFVTDDFFGFLDDNEGGNIINNQGDIDIAIGRIPVSTVTEANGVVDKLIRYTQVSSFGDWRNELTFVADDEDNNLHFKDAEILTNLNIDRKDYYNIDKIYLDAFPQVNSSGGDRYPAVNDAILRKLFKGTFLMNYSGHGGPENWAQERVFNIRDIRNLNNIDKLPLFITATCDFAPYDDPNFHSAGETLLTNARGGAIALITTTRLVFASANLELNRAVLQFLFREYEGRMPTVGEILMQAKNSIFGGENNRKFTLLGDPSMTLAYPAKEVVTTHVNQNELNPAEPDTLKALARVSISGYVADQNGNILPDFNGIIYPTVFDKPTTYRTRGNDAGSIPADFDIQNNILFKGKASVRNGLFEFEFIVPKDINYAFDNGKISYYAVDTIQMLDAHGFTRDFIVGGTADNFTPDNSGPTVELFINDTNFVFGGITHENPLLIARLEDKSGINTVGNGIGHDIIAILNENSQEQFQLNDFYQAELDDFTRGTVRFPFNNLADGRYGIMVRAWDVHNNPGTGYTEFVVVSSEKMVMENLMTYPNPMSNFVNFVFEHNRPGETIIVTIDIYDFYGRKVKTIANTIQSPGTRLSGGQLTWDGTSDYGAPLSNGMYVYKVNMLTLDGLKAQEFEKLIILR
jgi:hypothetical protein